jgi:hypothetical protein
MLPLVGCIQHYDVRLVWWRPRVGDAGAVGAARLVGLLPLLE